MQKKTILKWLLLLVLAGALVYAGIRVYVRLYVYNPAASCANCRSFIRHYLEEYADSDDGWYPRGGTNSCDSLSQCVKELGDVHFFTSHSLTPGLRAYWTEHRTFSPDFCCYHYVEGLREDDPAGLILLYFNEPTKWECHSRKGEVIGRPVSLTPPGHSWEFLPEQEFQEKHELTLKFLRENGRLAEAEKKHNKAIDDTGE